MAVDEDKAELGVLDGDELALGEASELLEDEEELLVDVERVVGEGICKAGQ